MKPGTLSHDPFQAFLDEHPLTRAVELLLPDLNGIPRGKRVGLDEARSAMSGGTGFTTTVYALDVPGHNVDDSGLVWEEGDADRPCAFDPATLRPLPWRPDRAQVIGGLLDHDGQPFFGDPRHALRKVVDRLAAMGLRTGVAVELEFYLVEAALGSDGMAQKLACAATGQRASDPEVYDFERLDEVEDMLDLVESWCEQQDLPYKGVLTEFGPGQYEVNLGFRADPVQAADEALMLKRLIKAAARATNRRATFMAKPFEGESGNGTHVHVSLITRDGRNLFGEVAEDQGGGEPALKAAVWGLQQAMDESALIMAPNANSFRRLQPMSYAPTAPTWGYNNRTVAFRVPSGPAKARRVEHRVAGADANPYLVVAAVLAGVMHGIEALRAGEKPEPEHFAAGNAYELDVPQMPSSWQAAIDAVRAGTILSRYLDPKLLALFAGNREAERRRFSARVTPTEFEWYLGAV